ncbi:hypothetical protein GWI33_021136 [Rhynchophorus ferrugineus]|uniref:Uncharacterized protein n=1 Tax=Rhynchophorus ferrugineus TaxID=354439 RepID=A0A834I1Z5_RHYFE|nr:hypothetical protein GWI33_021136 [Rhynchophorus ferrugineus]
MAKTRDRGREPRRWRRRGSKRKKRAVAGAAISKSCRRFCKVPGVGKMGEIGFHGRTTAANINCGAGGALLLSPPSFTSANAAPSSRDHGFWVLR